MSKNKIWVSVKVDVDLAKRLREAAKRMDCTRSWLIRSMLRKSLKETEKAA